VHCEGTPTREHLANNRKKKSTTTQFPRRLIKEKAEVRQMQEALSPPELRDSVIRLRVTISSRMTCAVPPNAEGNFFTAYSGHFTKPSPAEQEEWRTITPYRLRGKATKSLEQWAARFFAAKVLMNGVTNCTSNMILRRYRCLELSSSTLLLVPTSTSG
jgi:hypothetical protein